MEKLQKKSNKKLIIIIVSVVVILTGIIAAIIISSSSSKAKISKLIDAGNKYLSEMDYEQAIATFTKVIEIDPNNAGAYYSLALAYSGQGDVYLAQGGLEKALEAYKNAYNALQECIDKTGGNDDVKSLMDSLEIKIKNLEDSLGDQTAVNASEEDSFEVEAETNYGLISLQRLANEGDDGNLVQQSDVTLWGYRPCDYSMEEWQIIAMGKGYTNNQYIEGDGVQLFEDGSKRLELRTEDGNFSFIITYTSSTKRYRMKLEDIYNSGVDFGLLGLTSWDTPAEVLNKLGFTNGDEIADYILETTFDTLEEAEAECTPFHPIKSNKYEPTINQSYSFRLAGDNHPFDIGGKYTLHGAEGYCMFVSWYGGNLTLGFEKKDGEESYRLHGLTYLWNPEVLPDDRIVDSKD